MFESVIGRLRQELRDAVTPGPRMVDGLECVASVMLAIVFAHLIGAKMVAWAAFSAFVLMKGHVSETLLRAVMRIIGTAAGAGLALLIVPFALRSLPVASLSAAIVGAVGLYGMLTAKRAYTWLLFGLTFEMILLDNLEQPALDTFEFASTRFLEVVAGTAACVIVSVASSLTARRRWPAKPPAPAKRIGWHRAAASHAALAGCVLAVLPLLHALVPIPELAQAGVTIMAVMIVPAADLVTSGLTPVGTRLRHRIFGCLAGGALGAAVLLVGHGSPAVLIAGTCLGILIGRHIETGGPRFAYIGLQFTLAVLIVLVPDSYADAQIAPGVERMISILVGMALLQPILWLFRVIWPERAARRAPAAAGESE